MYLSKQIQVNQFTPIGIFTALAFYKKLSVVPSYPRNLQNKTNRCPFVTKEI